MEVYEWKGELKCPDCESKHIVKYGLRVQRNCLKQIYKCKSCGRRFQWITQHQRTIKVPTQTGRIDRVKAKESIRKLRLYRSKIGKDLLYIKYINEIDNILSLDISGEYKVILVKDTIKSLRKDERFNS